MILVKDRKVLNKVTREMLEMLSYKCRSSKSNKELKKNRGLS
jgi:hypothetical protein